MFKHELTDRVTHVGSRVTCNPIPTDTDDDYLVLVKPENWIAFDEQMHSAGWAIGGSDPEDSDAANGSYNFHSYTKDHLNVIATRDAVFYQRFIAATSVAKQLNLLSKDDRIMLFQAVLYGNEYWSIESPIMSSDCPWENL